MKTPVDFRLNGHRVEILASGHETLLDLLRGKLGLTGAKEGCGKGECGACTVLVDRRPVNSCLFPAPEVDGRDVVTIEGLTTAGARLSPLQRAFVEQGGTQCGFCAPGMVLAAQALLAHNPDPSEPEIRHALAGNLCRCTGYAQIVASVRHAARLCRATEAAS